MFFVSVFFEKRIQFDSIQSLTVRTARSSHSQVLKNLLNGGELYEIHFPGI